MPDEICTACGGTMHFDDFTRTLICSVCGSSRAISSAPATAPASAPALEWPHESASDLFPESDFVPQQPAAQPAAQVEIIPETPPVAEPETLPVSEPEVMPVAEPEPPPATQPETKPVETPAKVAAQPAKRPASAFPKAFQGTSGPVKKQFTRTAKPRPNRAFILSTKGKETLSAVRVLMGKGQFKEALDRLNKMQRSDKNTSAFLLLNLICGYQVNSTAEMLQKVADSPMAIQKLIFRPDWDTIAKRKPGTEDFPVFIKEYLILCLIQNGTSIRELRMKMQSPSKGPKLSPLAKLDEEDSHNAERAAQLKAARSSSYQTLADRMEALEDLPYPDYDYTFGSDDRYREYQAEIRAMAAAGEIRRQRGSEVVDQTETEEVIKFPQVRHDMSPEEITARKEELLHLISREEQKILE